MTRPPSPSRKGRPALDGGPRQAGRAPHRKINQAQERHNPDPARSGARECDPAGPAVRYRLPPAGCPISPDILLVLDLSEDLNRAMRQLRRKLDACQKCPLASPCGFRQAFQERVRAAIQAVNEEWKK